MSGRDGLQIFIICFQTIHIDNLIDGEQKRQNDTYPDIDITIPFVAWFIEYNTDALFYFVPTVYKLILQPKSFSRKSVGIKLEVEGKTSFVWWQKNISKQ